MEPMTATVELMWIPLGAGQRVARLSGRAFETISALIHGRRPYDLYHSALVVTVPGARYVVEMTPIPDRHGDRRGVVAEGAVGTRWLGKLRLFRYEIRRWSGGVIPDADQAVETTTLHLDHADARRLLVVVPDIPTPVWGRDECGTGEMWNSNSVTSWILQRAGIDASNIAPPIGGRAPGWTAVLVMANRCREIEARISRETLR